MATVWQCVGDILMLLGTMLQGAHDVPAVSVEASPVRRHTMHATRRDLPLLFGDGPTTIHGADWGGLRSMLVSMPAGTDLAPVLKGLPSDLCPCPHWGYVIRGRMRVVYADREELLQTGDLFYLPPGHTPFVEEDVEFVEFSRPEEYQPVMDHVQRVMAAASAT